MTGPRSNGFRLGLYVFKDAEIIDFAAPCGIASGTELRFHLLRRAGYSDDLFAEVARVMEYSAAYELYREEVECGAAERRTDSAGDVA